MPNITEYISRAAQANESAVAAEIITGGNVTPERAHQLRSAIEVAVESFDDSTALEYPELIQPWQPGTDYTVDQRVNWNGTLYKCLQAHTSQPDWTPDAAPSLWMQICETHAGTVDDPIPYSGNMELIEGLYYTQDGVMYRCTRSTGQPVYHALAELMGIYVEVQA